MKRTRIIAAILGLHIAMSVTAQATQTYKVAYIPTSIGQPNTNAWLEGMMRVFRKYPNVKANPSIPS